MSIETKLSQRYREILSESQASLQRQTTSQNFSVQETTAAFNTIKEIDIQQLWFNGFFNTKFTTTCGKKVDILEFGYWNHENGPDFKNAVIKINSQTLKGDIEIDMSIGDWYRHNHHSNPAFANCILHIACHEESKKNWTQTSNFKNVPQVILKPDWHYLQNNGELYATRSKSKQNKMPDQFPGECAKIFQSWDIEKTLQILQAIAEFRLYQKANRLAKTEKFHSTENAIFFTCGEILGYKNNKITMRSLAQLTPLNTIKNDSHATEIEAERFGLAGFLRNEIFDQAPDLSQSYLRSLWRHWWKVKGNFSQQKINSLNWDLAGIRPVNHPQRRLAALNLIEKNWQAFYSLLSGKDEKSLPIKRIQNFLSSLKHPFWSWHYTLTSKTSKSEMKLIGAERIDDFFANLFVPLFYKNNNHNSDSVLQKYSTLKSHSTNNTLKRLANLYFPQLSKDKKWQRFIIYQQGMLQLNRDFCQQSEVGCASCPLPELLSKLQ